MRPSNRHVFQKWALAKDRDCDAGLEFLDLATKTWSNCTDCTDCTDCGQGHGESKSLDPFEVPRDCGSPVLQREVGTAPTGPTVPVVVIVGSAKEPLR